MMNGKRIFKKQIISVCHKFLENFSVKVPWFLMRFRYFNETISDEILSWEKSRECEDKIYCL